MKKIIFIMLALFAFVATSCSSGYSEEKCKELCAKIEKGETLSQDEYSECIEQCDAIVDECKSMLESIKDDNENLSEKYKKFTADTREIRNYGRTMYRALESADLDEGNKEKFKELVKKNDEVGDLRKNIRNKVEDYND